MNKWLSHSLLAVLVFIATSLYCRQQYLARQNAVLRDYWALKTEHEKLVRDVTELSRDMRMEWLKLRETISR